MIATPASLRSDFIHIVGMAIYIAPESTNHITGIRTSRPLSVSTANIVTVCQWPCGVASFTR